jgi:hypothetical protein
MPCFLGKFVETFDFNLKLNENYFDTLNGRAGMDFFDFKTYLAFYI